MVSEVLTIVGARPQFIKAAAVSRALKKEPSMSEVLLHTGQHFDSNMSDIFFDELSLPEPQYHLGVGGGTHGQNTGRMIEKIEAVLIDEKPDCVMVFGDTDSTLAGALAAVKLSIPVAHVEAGLRSFNRQMPEEINRVLTDHIADLLLTPTSTANKNLERECISTNKIVSVGDVMFDSALFYADRARPPNDLDLDKSEPFALCTIHRAENTDNTKRLTNIINAINDLSETVRVVLPIHPRFRNPIENAVDTELSNKVVVCDPFGYLEMVWCLANCELVLTDSGGVQKEAFFHSKPCITLRDETEWVELQAIGVNTLFSPVNSLDVDAVLKASKVIETRLRDAPKSVYGDGQASEKIIAALLGMGFDSAA
jgi:UDP-GlcNAc3NAcA epimerase